MKKLNILLSGALLVGGASAAEITAVKVNDDLSKVDAKSSVWKSAKFAKVELYPQYTVGNNDKLASANLAKETKKVAEVAAVQNGKEIAFLLRWPDGTQSIQKQGTTNTYGDGFAIQFAKNSSDASKLPYIGMGSDGRSVAVYVKKAIEAFNEPNGLAKIEERLNANNLNLFKDDLKKHKEAARAAMNTNYTKAFVSEGFRSMTEVRNAKSAMSMNYSASGWSGTLTRALNDDVLSIGNAIPVAFALWDGVGSQRDGAKLLSGWNVVIINNDATAKALSAEIHKVAKGDVTKGLETAKNNCAACHSIPGLQAPAFMAPGLQSVGGQATYSYLKESILDPNAVVVPGYNRNAHPNTPWYNVENGARISTMPAGLVAEGQDLEDLIAYLQTLKGEIPVATKGGKK